MPSVQQLKSRIKSVNSTKQITKAMQLVAASKMRRATTAVKETTDYATAARELLADLAHDRETVAGHPLFKQRQIKKRLLIVISSDTGLAGAYNANILKKLLAELQSDDSRHIATEILTLGRKVSQFASRLKNESIIGAYEKLPDQPTSLEIKTILSDAIDYFREGKCDAVDLIFTRFHSSISQEVVVERLLPAGAPDFANLSNNSNLFAAVSGNETGAQLNDFNSAVPGSTRDLAAPEKILASDDNPGNNSAKNSARNSRNASPDPHQLRESQFEPSRQAVLDAVAERLVETEIVQALLDSRASEHSMRMLAMKNATDNATSLSSDLTLAMNKERQAAITQELSEISAGAEAVK